MEHQPRPWEPRHERLADVAPGLFIAIEAGLDEARATMRDIDSQTARYIARALTPTPNDALDLFSQGLPVDNFALRRAYMPIYEDETTSDEEHKLVDWLGTYAVHRENPAPHRRDRWSADPVLGNALWFSTRVLSGDAVDLYIAGDTPLEYENELVARLELLVERYGEPFVHYLGMNDVNAADDDLENSFVENFRGDFDTQDEALRGLVEVDDIESEIKAIADRHAGGEFVQLDRIGLWERVCEIWHVIESDGRYIVFEC